MEKRNPHNIQHYQGKKLLVTNSNFNVWVVFGKCEKIMNPKKWMNEKENILLQSSAENDRADQDWALDTSLIIIRDTEFHPV